MTHKKENRASVIDSVDGSIVKRKDLCAICATQPNREREKERERENVEVADHRTFCYPVYWKWLAAAFDRWTNARKTIYVPLHVIRMANIMPLRLFVDVVKHDNGGHEIRHFTGGQLVQIRAAILATVPVHPIQFQFFRWCRLHFTDIVCIFDGWRRLQEYRPATQKHFQVALFFVVGTCVGAILKSKNLRNKKIHKIICWIWKAIERGNVDNVLLY